MKLRLSPSEDLRHNGDTEKLLNQLRRLHNAAVCDLKNAVQGNGESKKFDPKKLTIVISKIELIQNGGIV